MTVTEVTTPRSLTSIVSPTLREKIQALPSKFLDRPEHEIIFEIRKEFPEWTPSETDFGIRLNFWKEYTYAQEHGIQMRMSNLSKGVCSDVHFSRLTSDPHRLAYILCEFADETQKRKLGLSLLWNEMLKIIKMEVPINAKTGVPEPKIIATKVDLFKFLYAYQHGQPIQKIEQQNKNLNYNIEAQEKPQLTMDEINEKLKLLEGKAESSPTENNTLLAVEKVISESGRVSEEFKR